MATDLEAPQQRASAFYLPVKRAFDILFSLCALSLLSPLFLLIALAIVLDSSGPVLYRQKRVRGNQDPNGAHPERILFDFFKFRSMFVDADSSAHRRYMTEYIQGNAHTTNHGSHDAPIFKMMDDPRITRVGRFLRRTSLDELPQLLSVLKGDMSLVGPRPALPYEVAQYSPIHRRRLVPRAGLTGLWQVSGRTRLTFEQMVALDVDYSRRCCLWLDLQILLKTLPAVLSREGAW